VTITVSAGEFQSLTGVPGQLALARRYRFLTAYRVSIPNGRPRLFSPRYDYRQKHDCYCEFQSLTGVSGHLAYVSAGRSVGIRWSVFQSLTGVPGHLAVTLALPDGSTKIVVSIPNGRPRPFSQLGCVVSENGPPEFQSLTGVPGHLASGAAANLHQRPGAVSIPNGRPRPFSH